MTTVGPWPIYPMGERIKNIDDELPVTILYGAGEFLFYTYEKNSLILF